MIEHFDLEGFTALVWKYANLQGIITPISWEKIISKSFGGIHIPGDKYMADGKKDNNGINIKSLKIPFNKGKSHTLKYVGFRCPLSNEKSDQIGKGVIKTFVGKRDESFKDHNLDIMYDAIVIHNRSDDDKYRAKLFVFPQEHYEKHDYKWNGNLAYLNTNKNDKNWSKDWKLKRCYGNSSYGQSCVLVRKKFNYNHTLADIVVQCDEFKDIDMEEAKKEYKNKISHLQSV